MRTEDEIFRNFEELSEERERLTAELHVLADFYENTQLEEPSSSAWIIRWDDKWTTINQQLSVVLAQMQALAWAVDEIDAISPESVYETIWN